MRSRVERKIKMEKIIKPFGYEPKRPQNRLHIKCPFRFFMEIQGSNSDCIGIECALWLPIQKACSLQVVARGFK